MRKSAYARHRGVSPAMVTHLAKSGRVVFAPDGKRIDVEASDALLARTLDPTRGGQNSRRRQAQRQPVEQPSGAQELANNAPAPNSLNGAKVKREKLQLERLSLRLHRERGELTEVAAVQRGVDAVFRAIARAVELIPDRVAPRLVGVADVRGCHDILACETERVLRDLAADLLTLPTKWSAGQR